MIAVRCYQLLLKVDNKILKPEPLVSHATIYYKKKKLTIFFQIS